MTASTSSSSRKELVRALRAAFDPEQQQQHTVLYHNDQHGNPVSLPSSSAPSPAAQQPASTSAANAVITAATATATATATEEMYEPPAALVDAIDSYASSSDIQANGERERDTTRLQEALLEDCYNEGILALNYPSHNDIVSSQSTPTAPSSSSSSASVPPSSTSSAFATPLERRTSLQARLRSALVLVLERFSTLDSNVVTPEEVRYVWWMRLLRPALLPTLHYRLEAATPVAPSLGGNSNTPGSMDSRRRNARQSFSSSSNDYASASRTEHIRVGRSAARAARELVVKSLSHNPEEKDNVKWRNEIFNLYERAHSDLVYCQQRWHDQDSNLAQTSTAEMQELEFDLRNLQEVLVGFGRSHPKVGPSSLPSNKTLRRICIYAN